MSQLQAGSASSFYPFDLVAIFQCSVELADALTESPTETWLPEVETAANRLLHVLNPRKAIFPSNHEWELFAHYQEDGIPWPSESKPRPGWAQELDLADASKSARQALMTIGLSLADLRGIPQHHQRGRDLLCDGAWNLWDGMQRSQRDSVQHLLDQTHRIWGWPDSPDSLPNPFSGMTASLSDSRILSRDWRTGNLGDLNQLQSVDALSNYHVGSIELANDRQFPIYRSDCRPSAQFLPSVCPKADPKPPVEILPEGDVLAIIESRFRSLGLIKESSTIHWVGRQNSPETTCSCHLSIPEHFKISDQLGELRQLRQLLISMIHQCQSQLGGRLTQDTLSELETLSTDLISLCNAHDIPTPCFQEESLPQHLKWFGPASLPVTTDQPVTILPLEEGQRWADEWRAVRVFVEARIFQAVTTPFIGLIDTRETPLTAPAGLSDELATVYELTAKALLKAAEMLSRIPTRWRAFSELATELSTAWNLAREKYSDVECLLQLVCEPGTCSHQKALNVICEINDACGHIMLKSLPFHRAVDHLRQRPPFDLAPMLCEMRQQISQAALQEKAAVLVPQERPAQSGEDASEPNKERLVQLGARDENPIVCGNEKDRLTMAQYNVIQALLEAGERGLTKDDLDRKSGHSDARKILKRLVGDDPDWKTAISFPGTPGNGYRIL